MWCGPQVHPLTDEWPSASIPDQTVLSRTHTFHTHLCATGGMPEEPLLSPAQASVSALSPGGHEGSFSLMSLFVLFQSAASSDGGEYNYHYYHFTRVTFNIEVCCGAQTWVTPLLSASVTRCNQSLVFWGLNLLLVSTDFPFLSSL